MVIIINGSVGVGKTSVSWELMEKFEKAIMLDGDYIGAIHPFDIYDEERIEYLYRTIEFLVKFHMCNGYEHFIINYVFETPDSLRQLVDKFVALNCLVKTFYLTCSDSEQKERIMKRSTDQKEWELKRYLELNQILAAANQSGDIGIEVKTIGKEVSEVAEEIWNMVIETKVEQ